MEESAQANRNTFRDLGVVAVTILSAPRAGKTSILERMLPLLKSDFHIAVIAGDLYAPFDAERIRDAGAPVWQVPARGEPGMDAAMIARAIRQFPLGGRDLLLIESVADPAVEPADLGEDLRIVIHALSESADIARLNPELLQAADAVVLNKIDLLADSRHAVERFTAAVRRISSVPIFPVSCRSDQGILELTRRLGDRVREVRRSRATLKTAGSFR